MILICHRGNLNGKALDRENNPDAIRNCIALGYDVEIDIRSINNQLWLGHDNPQYRITIEWIIKYANKLWIHCKNLEAFTECSLYGSKLNYFYHDKDAYTLTSKQIIWAYPGSSLNSNTICVLPELFNYDNKILKASRGICSDNILFYEEELSDR